MAIEEKQRALEFTFVPDDIDGDLKYDITYDDSNPVFPLQISTGGNRTDYPLALFVDVVEFLTSKGVIHPKVLSRTVATHGMTTATAVIATPAAPASSIPVPQVTKKDGSQASISLTSNVDPLASFDITGHESSAPLTSIAIKDNNIPPTPELVAKMEGAPPIPQITKAGSGQGPVIHADQNAPPIPSIKTDETLPSSISNEIKSRPVIRSRVTGDDPQSAEKAAAAERASQGKGAGKAIRKAHRVEGE